MITHLTLSWIILKIGQTYFKNLAVFTPQDLWSMFSQFSTFSMKGLKPMLPSNGNQLISLQGSILILTGFRNFSDILMSYALREKYPYSEFFWSVFSRIRTEYGDLQIKSPYSVRMRENTDQKNSKYGYFLRSDATVLCILIYELLTMPGCFMLDTWYRQSYYSWMDNILFQNIIKIQISTIFPQSNENRSYNLC